MNPVVTKTKTSAGNFFEDFALGQVIHHATPRTITAGDVSLYSALYGTRFAVQSAESFAQMIGYPRAPVDDLLVFHVVFGKTVPDISLNAVANLGYAACRFLAPVYPGDTLIAGAPPPNISGAITAGSFGTTVSGAGERSSRFRTMTQRT